MSSNKSKLLSGIVLAALIFILTQIPTASAESADNSLTNFSSLWMPGGDALAFFNFRSADVQSDSDKHAPESCAAPPANLVSWYRGENNANDSKGTNNGTLQNGVSFTAGKVGQAFNFTNENQRVEIPDNDSLDLTTAVTLEAWVAPSQIGNPNNGTTIMHKGDISSFGNQPYSLHYNREGTAVFRVGNSSTFSVSTGSTTVLPLNTFTHIVGTYDGTTSKIYINGVLEGSSAENIGAMVTNNLPLRIGNNGAAGFVGKIDEPTIYSRALSSSEVQAIFSAGSAGKCFTTICTPPPVNQVSWFRAEDNGNDSQGTNNGTLNGVTFADGEVGRAFNFTAQNQFVSIPNNPALFPSNALSIEAWINPSDYAGCASQYRIFHTVQSSLIGYATFLDCSNGKLIGEIFDSSGTRNRIDSNAAIPTETFTHIAMTWDGANLRLYFNGVLDKTQATTISAIGFNPDPLRIGNASNFGFKGQIDEVSLYNRALSESEIQAIFNAGSAGKCITASLLQISPATTNVNIGTTQNFAATGGSAPYSFSIVNANPHGSINASSGVYTANTVGTDIVRVTDALGATSDATVTITDSCVANQKTWDGGGAGENWSEAANWSCDAVPTLTDTVFFNGTSTKNAAIDTSVTLSHLQINTGYTGTITQGAASSVAFNAGGGTSNYTQSSGTFACGGAAVSFVGTQFTLNGGRFNCAASDITAAGTNFNLSGGTFEMPSGTFTLGDPNGSSSINRGAGATLNHNNGTLLLRQSQLSFNGGAGTQDFNNVTVVSSNNGVSGTMRVLGSLNLQQGLLSLGTAEAFGNVTVANTYGANFFGVGPATLKLSGNTARTVTLPSGMPARFNPIILDAPNVLLNLNGTGTVFFEAITLNQGTIETGTTGFDSIRPYTQNGGTFTCGGGLINMALGNGSLTLNGGAFNCAASEMNLTDASLDLNGGTFTAPAGTFNFSGSFLRRGAAAIFNHNNGTLRATGNFNQFIFNNATGTQDLFNVIVNSTNFFNVGGTLRVLGTLDLQTGALRGDVINIEGDVTVGSAFTDNVDDPINVSFTGGNNQTYTNNGGANARGTWTINKTAGTTLTAATSLNLQTDQPLNITSGTLYLNENSNLTTGQSTFAQTAN